MGYKRNIWQQQLQTRRAELAAHYMVLILFIKWYKMIKYTFFQGCSLITYDDGQYSWQKTQISMNLKGPQVTHGNGMFS